MSLKKLVLSRQILQEQLTKLNNGANRWRLIGEQSSQQSSQQSSEQPSELIANYKFKNFITTWKFLNLVAQNAQRMNHHPTITTTYNIVDLKLTTHDVGNRVTYRDLQLATAIEKEYSKLVDKKLLDKKPLNLLDASKIIGELVNLEDKHK